MHIILIIWLLYLNLKNQTWRSIPRYSGSILYVIFFNGMYFYLCKDRLLWDFRAPILTKKALRRIQIFLITPLFILLFLSKFPKTLFKRIFYIIKWIGMSLIIEWVALQRGNIVFKYGWNLRWSMFVYTFMYPFSYLISIKPLITLVLSFLSTVFLLIRFRIQIPIFKHLNVK